MKKITLSTIEKEKVNFEKLLEELQVIDPSAELSFLGEEKKITVYVQEETLQEAIEAAFNDHAPAKSSEDEFLEKIEEQATYLSVEKIKELEARIAALEKK